MKAPRTRLLGRVVGLPVYLVDGERVRNEVDIEFTCGAHGYVYPWCPKGEIWIDDAMRGVIDRMGTAYHEAIERDLMKGGMGYDRAHGISSRLEVQFRRELAERPPGRFDGSRVTAQIKTTCPHCA